MTPEQELRVSMTFADEMLHRLLNQNPNVTTYADIARIHGPSTATLVDLAKARRGEVIRQKPRKSLFESLNRALSTIETNVATTAEEHWLDVIDRVLNEVEKPNEASRVEELEQRIESLVAELDRTKNRLGQTEKQLERTNQKLRDIKTAWRTLTNIDID